ncbi:hypothetical protein AAVH_28251, partial [Aphelenchoides avenae]
MLPIDAFVEVASFLGHYDLGGLKLATKLCSSVANHCAGAIRVFDFSDFAFYVFYSWIDVYRFDSGGSKTLVCSLELRSMKNLAEFICDGLRNCTVGRIYLATLRVHVRNAIKAVADTIVVADKLEIDVGLFENEQALIEFVDSFRQVN